MRFGHINLLFITTNTVHLLLRSGLVALNLSEQQAAFQFKGGALTVTTLELFTADVFLIEEELQQQTRRAPAFFSQTPVVLAFDKLSTDNTVALDLIVAACKQAGLVPIAVRCAQDTIKLSAQALGLGWFPPQGERRLRDVAEQQVVAARKPARIVRNTVRSGQQVYAEGTDLVILGSVNEGAEVIADGNVHIWGALRGRAIAGAQGDQVTRIFCQQFKAELVSIGGIFQTFEAYDWPSAQETAIEIYLEDERLVVHA